MPSVNIYTSAQRVPALEKILGDLRSVTARELSGSSRELVPEEMSLRVITPAAAIQIADTEIEINAYNYPERAAQQDEICRSVRDYVTQAAPGAGSVYVWLKLCELGHSG